MQERIEAGLREMGLSPALARRWPGTGNCCWSKTR